MAGFHALTVQYANEVQSPEDTTCTCSPKHSASAIVKRLPSSRIVAFLIVLFFSPLFVFMFSVFGITEKGHSLVVTHGQQFHHRPHASGLEFAPRFAASAYSILRPTCCSSLSVARCSIHAH